MWISRKKWKEMQDRIERLERWNRSVVIGYVEGVWRDDGWGPLRWPERLTMNIDDAIQQIMAHVGLEPKKTKAVPEMISMVKIANKK